VPVAQNIHQGGYGAVERGVRWSDVDLSDGGIDGGDMQIATVGVNWCLSSKFALSVNYQSIWNERAGSKGRADVLVTRVLLSTDQENLLLLGNRLPGNSVTQADTRR
jgi:phosphate-selective porin